MAEREKEGIFLVSPEDYRAAAIETIKKMKDPEILKLIYYFVKSGYKEEKAGSE